MNKYKKNIKNNKNVFYIGCIGCIECIGCIGLLIITFNKISIGIKVCKLSLVCDLVGCSVIVHT